jgi:hypothetical protein
MHVGVGHTSVACGVFFHREASIALVIEIDDQRIPIHHQNPLTKIKLPGGDEKRVLHILLNNPMGGGVGTSDATRSGG